ncbi:hypothetical protein BGZ98_003153 [Dissophora globulifera]|nr:hypothetical protein BGZ98_003153 [Dissophora globulifera]
MPMSSALVAGLPASLKRLLPLLFSPSNLTSKVLGAYFMYLLIKYRHTAIGARPRPELNGPRGLPFIGNFISTVLVPRETLLQRQTRNHELYGDVYTVSVPGIGRIVTIMDPEKIDHVLRVNFWAYEKGARFKESLRPLVGDGIFSADGEHWKWQRKLASHIFSVKAFRQYTSDVFCHEGQLVIDYLEKVADTGKPIDLQRLFHCYTLDSFGEIAFGQSFGCLKDPDQEVEFAAAFDRLNVNIAGRFMSPIWRLKDWWTGNAEKVREDTETVHRLAHDLIRDRRKKQAEKEKDHDESKSKQKDLLQLFMDISDGGESLSDDMLVDSVLNFIIAGRDTTAQALSWMFYLLHRTEADAGIFKSLVKETDDVLQGGLPTYESTKQQKFAESCFYESLRLYPSVPKNVKTCVEDDVLPGGLKIYKGELVNWSLWAMGRATSLWGPDAKEYKPERWMTGEKPSSAKFVSFHHGPRTCLGQQFATIEAITIMSMMAQKFTFELVDPSIEPAYAPSLTLPVANGLPVRVKRRVDNVTAA